MNTCIATAHTNIALIKYWGKSGALANLPATGSLSLTLDKFWTTTIIQKSGKSSDEFEIQGQELDSKARQRVVEHVDYFRELCGKKDFVRIESTNNVPLASGLASSASGFAALTMALSKYFGLSLEKKELSKIARRGSGSAARSLFAGLVLMHGGPEITSEASFAEPIDTTFSDEIALIVLECARGKKSISSTKAMNLTSESSVFYKAFVNNHPLLLSQALEAIEAKDLEQLGLLMEQSTLQMHATLLGLSEPIWYINPTTLLAMNFVREQRKNGVLCYFTMDAGPHVKVLCKVQDAAVLVSRFSEIDGVTNITSCRAGPGAYLHE